MVGMQIRSTGIHIFLSLSLSLSVQNSSQTTVICQTTAVLSRTREQKEVAVSFWKIYVFRKLNLCDDKVLYKNYSVST